MKCMFDAKVIAELQRYWIYDSCLSNLLAAYECVVKAFYSRLKIDAQRMWWIFWCGRCEVAFTNWRGGTYICGWLGYSSLLLVSCWQSRRDAKEVQGHHQDIPFNAHRCPVCTLRWWPKGVYCVTACFACVNAWDVQKAFVLYLCKVL